MLKSIKKLFSIDETEVDIDEIDTEIEEKKELYKKQLTPKPERTPVYPKLKNSELDDNSTKYTEVKSFDSTITNEPVALDEIKEIQENTKPLVDDSEINKASRRSFDFEQVIEKSYEPQTKKEEVVEEVEQPKEIVKENKKNNEYTRDNYVLKDLISPMRGVVRKEKPMPKKGNDHKKANIIKLREEVKTKELEAKDDYKELLDYTQDTIETKDLESSLNQLSNQKAKDTLSETSRFTLIEDSTGEMRLVIDEDE